MACGFVPGSHRKIMKKRSEEAAVQRFGSAGAAVRLFPVKTVDECEKNR